MNQKAPLGMYAIWMRYHFDTPAVEGAAVFLRDRPQCLSETFTPDIERMVLDYLDEKRQRLNRLDEWPPSPGPLCDWCGWCGWKLVCPAFDDG